MSTQEFETQRGLDDAFEAMMEREEDKTRIRACIAASESEIEYLKHRLSEEEENLSDLQEELEELES